MLLACSGPQQATPSAFRSPAIVDSHVHLAFDPVGDALAAHGVLAVVDLAAPERTLGTRAPVAVIAAGPMITSPGGYPLDSWGADGYGIGCAEERCVIDTIDRLAKEGARVIKVPLDRGGLDPALLPVAVRAAHERHLRVAVHALTEASAARAAAAGVDVLAHTPIEPLSDATVAAWRGRAVITTLAAFGGAESAIENLRRLRAAGVTVLYGTDLGNLRVDGASADELALMRRAGLGDQDISDAMTTVPLHYWGFELGDVHLELDRDPHRDAAALLSARVVR